MERRMPEQLQKIIAAARVRHIRKGQIVFYGGDPMPEVFIIKSGVVKLHSVEEGNEKILHLLRAGSVMPLAFFSGGDARTRWYYTALSDCDLYVFRKETLDDLVVCDGRTATYLANRFSEDVHEVLVRLESLSRSNINAKLGATLRYLMVCHAENGRGNWCRIPFAVNYQLLANMIGVTRESTSIAMKALADKGIVRYPRFAQLEINGGNLRTFLQDLSPNGNGAEPLQG